MKKFTLRKNRIIVPVAAVLLIGLLIGVWGGSLLRTSGSDSFDVTSAAFSLPKNSSEMSLDLAKALLKLNMGNGAELTAGLYGLMGFDVVLQKNFDKKATSTAHTSAYTIGMKVQETGGVQVPVLLVTIRGTSGSEWLSNFDVAPSHLEDTEFAENFLYDAEDVLVGLQGVIDGLKVTPADVSATLNTAYSGAPAPGTPAPVIVVTGFSRGAAAANLLGVLLDEMYPDELVYVYTFATPATLRGDMALREYPNIFNFLNERDLVPRLPLEKWGFKRAGTDYVLENDKEGAAITPDVLDTSIDKLFGLAPDLKSYYGDKHSLTEKGLSDKGISTFDMMLVLADSLGKEDLGSGKTSLPDMSGFSEDSDFAVLFDILEKITADDNKLGAEILNNHLPTEYQRLLENPDSR